MSITIKHKPINLYEFNVRTPAEEIIALDELQGQIKTQLSTMGIKPNEIETLLINKLVYYSVKEIQTVNPNLKISMGWYRYGPCFERMRKMEMDKYSFNIERKSNAPIKEIINNCKIETPLFIESRKIKDTPKGMYFYEYLKHIYTDRVDIPELADFYKTKHELSHETYMQAYDSRAINTTKMIRAVLNFNKAICENDYAQKIGLETSIIEKTEDYLHTFQEVLIENNERHLRNEINSELDAFSKYMVVRFEDVLLSVFAYKNYKATYTDLDSDLDTEKKNEFDIQIEKNLATVTKYLTNDNLDALEKFKFKGA